VPDTFQRGEQGGWSQGSSSFSFHDSARAEVEPGSNMGVQGRSAASSKEPRWRPSRFAREAVGGKEDGQGAPATGIGCQYVTALACASSLLER
jgi:hypothetical protein